MLHIWLKPLHTLDPRSVGAVYSVVASSSNTSSSFLLGSVNKICLADLDPHFPLHGCDPKFTGRRFEQIGVRKRNARLAAKYFGPRPASTLISGKRDRKFATMIAHGYL